jgi:hypothetical protein
MSPPLRAVGKWRARWVVLVVLAMLVLGIGLRATRINDPLVDFSSTRQHHLALIARQYTEALFGNRSGLDRSVMLAAALSEIEPPFMEAATAVAWRLFDQEATWVPRTLAILAWTVGGWLLLLLLRRLASPVAAMGSVAVWSLLPFAVNATRTFQPEVLMVSAIVGAILALVVYDDSPTQRLLVIAGLAGGFTVLVKVPAMFLVVPVFLALAIRRGGMRSV